MIPTGSSGPFPTYSAWLVRARLLRRRNESLPLVPERWLLQNPGSGDAAAGGLLCGRMPLPACLFHHLRVDRPVLLHEVCEQAGEAIVLIPGHAADFLADRILAHGSPPSKLGAVDRRFQIADGSLPQVGAFFLPASAHSRRARRSS